MERAKQAASDFLHKSGKHDTTVHETVNPAVQNENVTRTRHENVQEAVDREVHQDHHHTTVQPIAHKEVLPEQHSHNLAGVEHRSFKHGDDSHVKERLAAEAAQFKNTRTVGETQHSSAVQPGLSGEHVHHHVHETIQPVINKETVQPHVVHTTVPIHEVHQNEAKHHTASALPGVTMAEFQKAGGVLGGREERTDAFQGEPKPVGGTLGGTGAQGSTTVTDPGHGTTGHHHDGSHHHTGRDAAALGGAAVAGQHGTHSGSGYTGNQGSALTDADTNQSGSVIGGGHQETTKKASLLDKINPMKDSNGDGTKGFMK